MSYVTPIEDIRQTMVDASLVDNDKLLAYLMQDPLKAGKPYFVNILQDSGTSNPRWARDNFLFTFQIMGADRSQMNAVRQKIWEIYNFFVGKPSFVIGDYAYMQFNSINAPTFVGYQENSKPLFTCSVSLVRESQVQEGNRDPIC